MTYLYRFYDANGALLYVGITGNLEVRIREHEGAPWFGAAERLTYQWFADRSDARASEARAIREEGPQWNRAGSANPPPRDERWGPRTIEDFDAWVEERSALARRRWDLMRRREWHHVNLG